MFIGLNSTVLRIELALTNAHQQSTTKHPGSVHKTNWRQVVAQWLRHCATKRKVVGSIADGVTGIFHQHNRYGHTVAF
jgi:hypothetical protein